MLLHPKPVISLVIYRYIVVFTDALREAEARILDIHDIGVIELRAGM